MFDNNAGPETYDEQPLRNHAIVHGTYQAPSKAGRAVTVTRLIGSTRRRLLSAKPEDRRHT